MPSPYWQSQMSGFNEGLGNIGRALALRPQLAARNALYQAEAEQKAAEIGEANARTGLYKNQADKTASETDETNFRLSQLKNITSALLSSGAMKVDPKTGVTTLSPEAGQALFSATVGSSKGGNDTALATGNLLKGINAAPEAGLDRQNKAAIAAASDAERAGRPVNVSPGAVALDPQTGQPIFRNPSAASKTGEANLFDTVTEKYPAVEAKPADITPASQGGWFSRAHPAITNSPAIAYQPERTVTRKIPSGTIASTLQSVPESPSNQPKVMTPEIATQYLQKFGDRAKAEAAAKQDGFTW